ncbi:MAG: DUF1287 domain-containing protein [Pseudomonadota bacterium]
MLRSARASATRCALTLAGLLAVGCSESNAGRNDTAVAPAPAAAASAPSTAPAPTSPPLVAAARSQIGVTVVYDPAYVVLPYPGGDVPKDRGVCTDVVIRALRTQGLDLQHVVHEDMRGNFAKYPQKWGLRGPDRNIDHRRVPNLQTYFARNGWSLTPSREAADYRAGDLVTWMLPGNLPHIGIVSDRRSYSGTPLILHNIGNGTREDDILFAYAITGHYRPKLP